MAVVLALGAAVVFGSADFLGGMATRRARVLAVVTSSQLAGLVVLAPALALLPADPSAPSLAWGAAAGLAGGTGLACFYRALATGAMSVVAPLTGVCGAAVPVAAGLALGERPGAAALVGVTAALVAVALVSAEGGKLPSWAELTSGGATGLAVAAGTAFGLFFVLLDRAEDDAGMWPLAAARVASVGLVGTLALATGRRLALPRAARATALAAGIGDMAANVLYLLAVREGLLALVAVLVSLYPASTVLLAQVVLRERLAPRQVAGLGVAGVAAVLIAAG